MYEQKEEKESSKEAATNGKRLPPYPIPGKVLE
jgi:hypothetical protein